MNRAARRILGMVGLFLFVFLYGVGVTFYDDVLKPLFSTPTPTAQVTRIHQPTVTPIVKAILPPTATPNPCYLWSQITPQMSGSTVCVYGTVTDHVENFDAAQTFLYFGGRDKFFLTNLFRWEETEGTCVSVTGKVQLNTYKTPYIQFDDLSSCP